MFIKEYFVGCDMKCRCGYEGWAEIGEFPNAKWEDNFPLHWRCPTCRTNKNIIHLDSIDEVREALAFPNGRSITFIKGGADPSSVGYSIADSKGWGTGSAISIEDYEKLGKLSNIAIVTV